MYDIPTGTLASGMHMSRQCWMLQVFGFIIVGIHSILCLLEFLSLLFLQYPHHDFSSGIVNGYSSESW
jgi:hypothetical protein